MSSIARRYFSIKWIFLALLSAGIASQFLISCDSTTASTSTTGGTTDGTTGGSNSAASRYFKDSVEPIFSTYLCTDCHTPGGVGWEATGDDSGGLDLSNGNAYASLVNKNAFEHQFATDTIPLLRVKPGSLDSSYLYRKLSMMNPGAGTYQMPLAGDPISDHDLAIIRTWIQNGALLGDTTTVADGGTTGGGTTGGGTTGGGTTGGGTTGGGTTGGGTTGGGTTSSQSCHVSGSTGTTSCDPNHTASSLSHSDCTSLDKSFASGRSQSSSFTCKATWQ